MLMAKKLSRTQDHSKKVKVNVYYYSIKIGSKTQEEDAIIDFTNIELYKQ